MRVLKKAKRCATFVPLRLRHDKTSLLFGEHFVVLEHHALGLTLLLIEFFNFLVGTFTPPKSAASSAQRQHAR